MLRLYFDNNGVFMSWFSAATVWEVVRTLELAAFILYTASTIGDYCFPK